MIDLSKPVVIAGAGIGGLALAAALQRRRIPVRVLERTAALAPVGAGLVLQPNAMTVIAALGLSDAVIAAGRQVARAAILDARGRALGGEQDLQALTAQFGAPAVAIHRARLHRVLEEAVAPGTIDLGVTVVAFEARGGSVSIRCDNDATIEAAALVGADGLRSNVRRRLVGDGEPIYSGYTSWRGVTVAGRGPSLSRTSESWGRGERFGMADIGHGEIYWFAVANAPPGGRDQAPHAELLHRFGDWHEPIRAVLEATPRERIVRTDIADRQPITRWHEGRVALLGDAAHPMTPNLGQGACQAIEDAAVLAHALATHDTIESAFASYERQRVARANAIVMGARRLGAVAQWSNPLLVLARDTLLRFTPDRVTRRSVQSLWKSDIAI